MGLLVPLSHEIFGAWNWAIFLIGSRIKNYCFVSISVNYQGPSRYHLGYLK